MLYNKIPYSFWGLCLQTPCFRDLLSSCPLSVGPRSIHEYEAEKLEIMLSISVIIFVWVIGVAMINCTMY